MNPTIDPRYANVKLMIERKGIISFDEIFTKKIIPRTIVAKDLHKNNNTMKRLAKLPGELTLNDVKELARLINYDHVKLYAFISKGMES